VRDPAAAAELRNMAASQLRGHGADLDDATARTVDELIGADPGQFGGAFYGGYRRFRDE
jgi:hypothetical protein